MTTIPWLADVLRAAGLTVVEHAGWKTRMVRDDNNQPLPWEPTFGIVHATAAPRSQSDETQVRIVRDGREGLPGPIAVACVDRTGRWHVLAAGRCNTTLAGTAGPYVGKGNRYALGVEACNNNGRDGEPFEPWPAVQYDAYVRGWAAIAKRMGWGPPQLRGHKEHTPGHKTDPTFDMGRFRTNVAQVMEDDMPTVSEIVEGIRDMTFHDNSTLGGTQWHTYNWARGLPALAVQVAGLTGAVQKLAEVVAGDEDLTPEELTAAVQAGVTQAGPALTAAITPQLTSGLVAGLSPLMAGASEADVERIVTDVVSRIRLVPSQG